MWLLPALLLFLTGCCTAQDAITGPKMVSGQEQGSLTVQCHYDSSWKNYMKYWCQGAVWKTCEILVKTDMEQLVKKDRVSIRDDQTDFIVTVTMEELRISDAGIYWCAIERSGYDPYFKVNVSIDLAPEISTVILTTTAPVLTSAPPVLTSAPPVLTSAPPVLTSAPSTRESITNYGEPQTRTLTWFVMISIYFNLLVFLELPLILSMLSAVLWVNRPQRCSGGGEVGLGECPEF